MTKFVETVLLTIVSLIVGSFILAFVNSWWKRPRLSIKFNNLRNHTFFLKPVDPDLAMKGEKKPLPELFVQIGFYLHNKGDRTEVINAKLKFYKDGRWSKWLHYTDHKGGEKDYTTLDYKVGTQRSSLGKVKKFLVDENKTHGYLIFEFPFDKIPKYVLCKLRVIPVKGRSATKKVKVFPYSH